MEFDLKLGAHTFKFMVVPHIPIEDCSDLLGLCLYHKHQIYVADGLPPSLTAETAIHEVLHSIRFMYSLDNTDDEEAIVQITGHALTQVFKDNPEWFDWITSLLRA